MLTYLYSYQGRNAKFELIKVLQNGYRMEKPDNAPIFFGGIMEHCWKLEPNERPIFLQLQQMISDYMEPLTTADYLNVNVGHEPMNEEISRSSLENLCEFPMTPDEESHSQLEKEEQNDEEITQL